MVVPQVQVQGNTGSTNPEHKSGLCGYQSVISTSADIAQCRVPFELPVLTSRESVNLFLMVKENRAIPLEEIYLILIPLLSIEAGLELDRFLLRGSKYRGNMFSA